MRRRASLASTVRSHGVHKKRSSLESAGSIILELHDPSGENNDGNESQSEKNNYSGTEGSPSGGANAGA